MKPDLAISLEGGVTGDVFPGHPEETQIRLAAGPGIFLYDTSEMPNRKLTAFIKGTPPQKISLFKPISFRDTVIIPRNCKRPSASPTANLVVPVRYTHAHNGIINRHDFDQMVDLLVAVIQTLDATKVAEIRDFTPR